MLCDVMWYRVMSCTVHYAQQARLDARRARWYDILNWVIVRTLYNTNEDICSMLCERLVMTPQRPLTTSIEIAVVDLLETVSLIQIGVCHDRVLNAVEKVIVFNFQFRENQVIRA